MRRFAIALGMTLLPLFAATAGAQDGMSYVVSYVEVAPATAYDATSLLRQLRDASRKEAGAERFEVVQRTSHPSHFAVIEIWKDGKAAEAHAAAAHTKQFREKLQPMLSAPYDERPHTGMAVASGGAAADDGLFVVTHVDIIPPKKDDGIAALKTLAEPSCKDAGNVRYEVWQQNSRPNHFTLIERRKGAAGTLDRAAHEKLSRSTPADEREFV